MSAPVIRVRGLQKRFGHHEALLISALLIERTEIT